MAASSAVVEGQPGPVRLPLDDRADHVALVPHRVASPVSTAYAPVDELVRDAPVVEAWSVSRLAQGSSAAGRRLPGMRTMSAPAGEARSLMIPGTRASDDDWPGAQQDDPMDPGGVLRCKAQRPHVADRAADDVRRLELERVECPSQDLRDELSVVLSREVDRRAQPPAGPLEDDRAKAGQLADQRRPPARSDRAVDEEHGLARSDLQDAEACGRRVQVEEPLLWLEPVVLPQPPFGLQVAVGSSARRGRCDRGARHDGLPSARRLPLRCG